MKELPMDAKSNSTSMMGNGILNSLEDISAQNTP